MGCGHSHHKVWFRFFYPSLLVFYVYHNKDCPFTKVELFSKCSFGETCSQHLTTSSYTWGS